MVKFKMKIVCILAIGFFLTTTFLYMSSKNNLLHNQVEDFENVEDVYGVTFLRLVRNPFSSRAIGERFLVQNSVKKYGKHLAPTEETSISVRQIGNFSADDVIIISHDTVKLRNLSHLVDRDSIQYFEGRRSKMLGECSKYINSSSLLTRKREKFEHILVDEKNKMLFCYIPKVACTNWKRMLMLISGKSKNISDVINIPGYEIHAKNMFASLQNYSLTDIDFFIRNFSKIIFVRNPYERLLSAYRNKLEQHYNSSKYFQARFGKYIIKHFRNNPSNSSLDKGDDVTFEEFVKYLLASPRESYNEHWQTVNDLCHPCFLKYDIIGKYETLARDSKLVLKFFNTSYNFPAISKPSKTASSLKQYFQPLSPELKRDLFSVYEKDFNLFGYNSTV